LCVDATIKGFKFNSLVDCGGTITPLDRDTATKAGVTINSNRNQIVRTGNGLVRVSSGRAGELKVGTIERSDFAMHVTESDGLNVLGMNFLSTLERWGVEGRWLVLIP
jgi:aspartyl protease family protein